MTAKEKAKAGVDKYCRGMSEDYHTDLSRSEFECDLNQMFQAGYRAALERALGVVDSEPECPGDMPDEMWDSIKNDRDAATKALQTIARLTKRNITEVIKKELEKK